MCFWGVYGSCGAWKCLVFLFLCLKQKIIDLWVKYQSWYFTSAHCSSAEFLIWTLSRAFFKFQMHKPAINTERAREHDEHSTRYSSLFRLLQERVMPGRHECGCFFVHWLVCRWTKKASVWKSGCQRRGGGDFSASTVLGGSVTQQVNLIAEERRRATEQTDPHIFCLHSQTSVKQGLVCWHEPPAK